MILKIFNYRSNFCIEALANSWTDMKSKILIYQLNGEEARTTVRKNLKVYFTEIKLIQIKIFMVLEGLICNL